MGSNNVPSLPAEQLDFQKQYINIDYNINIEKENEK